MEPTTSWRAYSCQRKMWDVENGMSSPYHSDEEERACCCSRFSGPCCILLLSSITIHPSELPLFLCHHQGSWAPDQNSVCSRVKKLREPEAKRHQRKRQLFRNLRGQALYRVQALVTHWAGGVKAMRYGALFLSFFLFFSLRFVRLIP